MALSNSMVIPHTARIHYLLLSFFILFSDKDAVKPKSYRNIEEWLGLRLSVRWVTNFKFFGGSYNATNKNYNICLVIVAEVGSLWPQICNVAGKALNYWSSYIFPPKFEGECGGWVEECATMAIFVFSTIYTGLFWGWFCPKHHFKQTIFNSSDPNLYEKFTLGS